LENTDSKLDQSSEQFSYIPPLVNHANETQLDYYQMILDQNNKMMGQ
jgi:hypothetical protein